MDLHPSNARESDRLNPLSEEFRVLVVGLLIGRGVSQQLEEW